MTVAFPTLFGNEALKDLLSHQLRTDTAAHAYLIQGEHGSGKTMLARLLCMALSCRAESRPCGVCEACRKIREDLTPDIITIAPAPDRKQITVDQIRSLREEAYLSATELPIKAFLIETADAMNPQAQNALLKVLEEPPAGVTFLLMTDRPSALLPTVRSRTQGIKTELFSDHVLSDWMIAHLPEADRMAKQDSEAFSRLVHRAGGSIGRAQELVLSRKKAFDPDPLAEEYLDLLAGSSHSDFQLFSATLCKDRTQLSEVLSRLLAAVRDLTIRKKVPSAPCLFYRDEEKADALGARFTYAALISLHELFLSCTDQLAGNVNVATAQLLLSEHAWLTKSR